MILSDGLVLASGEEEKPMKEETAEAKRVWKSILSSYYSGDRRGREAGKSDRKGVAESEQKKEEKRDETHNKEPKNRRQ